MTTGRKSHWDAIYRTKRPTEVSWYQPVLERSLELIRATGVSLDSPLIDSSGA